MQVSKIYFNMNLGMFSLKNNYCSNIPVKQNYNLDCQMYNQATSNINKTLIHFTGIAEDNAEKIVKMRDIEGKSFREIANEIGCSKSYASVVYRCYTKNPDTNFLERKKEKIIKLSKKGYNQLQIADVLKINNVNLLGITLRRWGITGGIADRNKEKIILMAKKGKSAGQIADQIGCTRDTVGAALIRWNVVPTRQYKVDGHREEIERMIKEGYTMGKIVNETRCSEGTIRKALKKWRMEAAKKDLE